MTNGAGVPYAFLSKLVFYITKTRLQMNIPNITKNIILSIMKTHLSLNIFNDLMFKSLNFKTLKL